MAIQVAVLELHPGSGGAIGHEADLHFAGPLRVGLELPLRTDVPADHHPAGRLVDEHPGPPALTAVDTTVVHGAALTRLKDRLGQLRLQDVMFRWPPAADAIGEDRERPLDRSVDD